MHRIRLNCSTCLSAVALATVLIPFRLLAQQPASTVTAQRQISDIQDGLLPSVVIKGQPVPAMKLLDRMRYYHVPGESIAYFDHGQIEWAKAYGTADEQTGRPVTVDTVFQAGSISKPIAALGALRLVQSGKLKLDENVNDELTSWKLPDNAFTTSEKVTLQSRLLSHSGGVGVHGFGGHDESAAAVHCADS